MQNSKPVIGCSFSDASHEYSVIVAGEVREGMFFILEEAQMFCKPLDDRKPDSEFRKKIAELAKKWDAEILDTKKSFRHLEEKLETKKKNHGKFNYNKRSR